MQKVIESCAIPPSFMERLDKIGHFYLERRDTVLVLWNYTHVYDIYIYVVIYVYIYAVISIKLTTISKPTCTKFVDKHPN